jgi:hypothetical protein
LDELERSLSISRSKIIRFTKGSPHLSLVVRMIGAAIINAHIAESVLFLMQEDEAFFEENSYVEILKIKNKMQYNHDFFATVHAIACKWKMKGVDFNMSRTISRNIRTAVPSGVDFEFPADRLLTPDELKIFREKFVKGQHLAQKFADPDPTNPRYKVCVNKEYQHVLAKSEGQKCCKLCAALNKIARPKYYCVTCGVHLCQGSCFDRWHEDDLEQIIADGL